MNGITTLGAINDKRHAMQSTDWVVLIQGPGEQRRYIFSRSESDEKHKRQDSTEKFFLTVASGIADLEFPRYNTQPNPLHELRHRFRAWVGVRDVPAKDGVGPNGQVKLGSRLMSELMRFMGSKALDTWCQEQRRSGGSFFFFFHYLCFFVSEFPRASIGFPAGENPTLPR